MFQREWRRQALVLALLVVAVAATTVGLAAVSNAVELRADPAFGTANTILTLPGTDPELDADLAALATRFPKTDVVSHRNLPVPGSVATIDIRSQNPSGPYGSPTLRLDSGRYPSGTGEVAVTRGVAQTFGLTIGSTWRIDGETLRVVGVVENPLDLLDQFALLAPGQTTGASTISVLVVTGPSGAQSLALPSQTGVSVLSRSAGSRAQAEAIVLALGTLGLIFVGLMAIAGFAVMAQRRLRALGMLGSLGATNRHLRLAMLANGAAVGATAGIVGLVVGLAAWLGLAPVIQSAMQHRVNRLSIPWLPTIAAVALALLTATLAAWWPARAISRLPVMAALSGRPPRPQPAHRFAALGAVLLGGGAILLAFADRSRALFVIGGTLMTAVGLLMLAPLAIRAMAWSGRRAHISARLALRDLVRYQARSGAALGAVTLAVGISATIAISASATSSPGPGNLAPNQVLLYVSQPSPGSQVPPLTSSQIQLTTARVDQLATTLHAPSPLALDVAYDPRNGLAPAQPGPGGTQPAGYLEATLDKVTRLAHGEEINDAIPLYVATPQLLAHFGLSEADLEPSADVITSRTDLGGLQIFVPETQNQPGPPDAGRGDAGLAHPVVQVVHGLPGYTSAPGTLITAHGMQRLGFASVPAGWLIDAPAPLTADQTAAARQAAAGAGLKIETRTAQSNPAPLRNWATAVGILIALGVLGMTVGLIRSETANDLRTLTATGATSTTRRNLTAVTAGAIALLGAFVGTAGAYAALLAWHRSDLSPLGHVPVVSLVLLVAGLPLIATTAGWLLAGREPPAIDRRPLT